VVDGANVALSDRDRRARNALANGAVNLVAGMIQMDGATIAFPDEDDQEARRKQIDLYAIIRGARYSFHVAVGEAQESGIAFTLPKVQAVVFLGLVARGGFRYDLFEIDQAMLEGGKFSRGAIELVIPEGDLRQIAGFRERI